MLPVTVFKQVYDDTQAEMTLSPEEIDFGFTRIPCADCDGTGQFTLPDDTQEPCVCCKGTGWLWVTL